MFIDTEVGEMDESFADIFAFDVILVCSKSSESFLEHVDSKWIIASYHNVDPQVILVVVYQVRIGNILGNKDILAISDI